jgi:hypothetical protein
MEEHITWVSMATEWGFPYLCLYQSSHSKTGTPCPGQFFWAQFQLLGISNKFNIWEKCKYTQINAV